MRLLLLQLSEQQLHSFSKRSSHRIAIRSWSMLLWSFRVKHGILQRLY
jgi:hypothetical protein